MKKLFYIKAILLQVLVIVIMANIQEASAQNKDGQTSGIPENINKIFQTSCISCHGEGGRPNTLAKVDFSKWAEYDDTTKTAKAEAICKTMIEESMPPKYITKSNPEIIPSKEQIELVCKWAESFKPNKGGK